MKSNIKIKAIILLSSAVLCSWIVMEDDSPDFLKSEVSEIENRIQFRDSLNEDVSKVNVAWHLDHILITINKVYQEMEQSNPETYKGNFSFGRTMMFTFNRIPRGKATSPEIVRPPEFIDEQEIRSQLELVKKYLPKFDSLPAKAHFKHPYIGVCKRKQAKKFLTIHTNHHLAIINDILKEEL
ncbi:MAG: DUF1569 domain-containing protein [Bacteroidota bacterium]